jgi:hypothetical protein
MGAETVDPLGEAAFLARGARGLAGDFGLSGDADSALGGDADSALGWMVGMLTGLTGAAAGGRGESVGRRLAIGSSPLETASELACAAVAGASQNESEARLDRSRTLREPRRCAMSWRRIMYPARRYAETSRKVTCGRARHRQSLSHRSLAGLSQVSRRPLGGLSEGLARGEPTPSASRIGRPPTCPLSGTRTPQTRPAARSNPQNPFHFNRLHVHPTLARQLQCSGQRHTDHT